VRRRAGYACPVDPARRDCRCRVGVAGQPVNLGVQPSNCVITKLKIDKDRKAILDRKNRVADSTCDVLSCELVLLRLWAFTGAAFDYELLPCLLFFYLCRRAVRFVLCFQTRASSQSTMSWVTSTNHWALATVCIFFRPA
jgi:hypothetical protein